jgi:hypothetical protein
MSEDLAGENKKLRAHIKKMQEKCQDIAGSVDWLNDMIPVATEAVKILQESGHAELAERLDTAVNWGTAENKDFWHKLIAAPDIRNAIMAGLEEAKGETDAQRMERLSDQGELLRDLGLAVQRWRDDFLLPKYGDTDWKCPFVARMMELLSICEKELGGKLSVSPAKRKPLAAVVEAGKRLHAAWETQRLLKGQYEDLPVDVKLRNMPQPRTPELWKLQHEAQDEVWAAGKALSEAVQELDGAD